MFARNVGCLARVFIQIYQKRFIETLPRRGYRFIGAVERLDEAGEIVGLPAGSAAERTVSHYRLLEKLGEGGMGVVYKAEDTKLKRNVALKFLASHLTQDPKARERFLREAQAAAAVDHPGRPELVRRVPRPRAGVSPAKPT